MNERDTKKEVEKEGSCPPIFDPTPAILTEERKDEYMSSWNHSAFPSGYEISDDMQMEHRSESKPELSRHAVKSSMTSSIHLDMNPIMMPTKKGYLYDDAVQKNHSKFSIEIIQSTGSQEEVAAVLPTIQALKAQQLNSVPEYNAPKHTVKPSFSSNSQPEVILHELLQAMEKQETISEVLQDWTIKTSSCFEGEKVEYNVRILKKGSDSVYEVVFDHVSGDENTFLSLYDKVRSCCLNVDNVSEAVLGKRGRDEVWSTVNEGDYLYKGSMDFKSGQLEDLLNDLVSETHYTTLYEGTRILARASLQKENRKTFVRYSSEFSVLISMLLQNPDEQIQRFAIFILLQLCKDVDITTTFHIEKLHEILDHLVTDEVCPLNTRLVQKVQKHLKGASTPIIVP